MDGECRFLKVLKRTISYVWGLGKYVGNRPVKLKKADSTAIRPVEIGHRKAKQLEQELKKNRHKPY
jgi:hypothetical protein